MAAGAAYLVVIAAAIVVTSLDENMDGLEDNIGYMHDVPASGAAGSSTR